MRSIINLNKEWLFVKDTADITLREGVSVDLPHTWNAEDGFDGGNDYFRGSCLYVKTLRRAELPEADLYYLEFRGANASADVYANGERLFHHDGGYSTFRVDITGALTEETTIAVLVDNSPSDSVYPQMADFTFYGGLYRDVNLVCVSASHFDLEYHGAPGIKITPTVNGESAEVEVEVFVKGPREGQKLVYTLYDQDENELDRRESTDPRDAFQNAGTRTPISNDAPTAATPAQKKESAGAFNTLAWVIELTHAWLGPIGMSLLTHRTSNVLILILAIGALHTAITLVTRLFYNGMRKSMTVGQANDAADTWNTACVLSFFLSLVISGFYIHTTASIFLKILITIGLHIIPVFVCLGGVTPDLPKDEKK
jgi:hypothetical protein